MRAHDMIGNTAQEFMDKKLPYVKKQYGVLDTCNGCVTICKSREHAHKVADDDRWVPMTRQVSEWTQDTGDYGL